MHIRLAFVLICFTLISPCVSQRSTENVSNHTLRTSRPLAFPGAEGYGKFTKGGRGGAVHEVTNLDDSGPGSLRAAAEAKGSRTVVFRISGNIELKSELIISEPFITIAGQTAPGDGICISQFPLVIDADHVIIRHLRVRLGDLKGRPVDAISARYHKNIIIDHVSASWAIDETMSIYYCDSVTVQWCIISESLHNSAHPKGPHGFGGIWGGNYCTYHHNLLAHHTSRNPRFASGSPKTDFRNNVIYNWGYNSSYGGEAHYRDEPKWSSTFVNMVANYYKPGPATQPGEVSRRIINPSTRNEAEDLGKWYVNANIMEGSETVTADNWNGGVQLENADRYLDVIRADRQFSGTMPISEQPADVAYRDVLTNAGATLPTRDAVDSRICKDVRDGDATFEGATYRLNHELSTDSGKCGIIDSQNDVGGWPEYHSTTAPIDWDHDGIPDAWEDANKLNKKNPEDRNNLSAEGYTMLEVYLNSLIKN